MMGIEFKQYVLGSMHDLSKLLCDLIYVTLTYSHSINSYCPYLYNMPDLGYKVSRAGYDTEVDDDKVKGA